MAIHISPLARGGVDTSPVSHTTTARKRLRTLLAGIVNYFKNHRDYHQLLNMPEYMLKDMGIDRADVRKERARLFRPYPRQFF